MKPICVQLSRKGRGGKGRSSQGRARATCHKDKPHAARGLCHNCYQQWLMKNNPAFRVSKQASNSASNKRYRKRNPKKVKAQKLSKLYGMSLDQYETMLATQNGVCVLCK